jgi:hypothetical protein
MTESEQVWVYATDGQRRGPSSARQIAALISGDRLPARTPVWKPGMADWAPAGDIPEISQLCAPPVPRNLGRDRAEPVRRNLQPQVVRAEDADQSKWEQLAGVLADDTTSTESLRTRAGSPHKRTATPRAVAATTPPPKPASTGKRTENLRILALIVFASVGGVIGREIGRGVVPRIGAADRPTAVAFLSRAAEEMNRRLGLPKNLDSEVQLVRVEALEGILVYQNRFINYSKDQMDVPALEAAQRKALQKTVCTTPETRDNLLKRGITMRYVYRDRFETLVMSIDIRLRDCTP